MTHSWIRFEILFSSKRQKRTQQRHFYSGSIGAGHSSNLFTKCQGLLQFSLSYVTRFKPGKTLRRNLAAFFAYLSAECKGELPTSKFFNGCSNDRERKSDGASGIVS